MARVEIVVDANVVLVPIGVVTIAVSGILSFDTAEPSNSSRIQTITDCVVVRQRHPANQRPYPSRSIKSRAVGIPGSERPVHVSAKYIERRQIGRGGCGLHGVSVPINCRRIGKNVAVRYTRKIAEDALACLFSQDCAGKVTLGDVSLPIKQEKEESLVLVDRAADASAILISVIVVFADTLKIVTP